jgi:hypothetical protein
MPGVYERVGVADLCSIHWLENEEEKIKITFE